MCIQSSEAGWTLGRQSPGPPALSLRPHPRQEQFLVPDHTIKDISGASFAGFYYICFQKSAASIEGYYYHRSSEW